MLNDIPIWVLSGLIAFLILVSAFFSGSETGLISLNRYRLRHMAKDGHAGARRAHELLKRPDRLIGLILPRPREGIFAPMSDGILREAESKGYGVLMAGSLMVGREVAVSQEEAFCDQLLSRQVAGVLFGPLDVPPGQAQLNAQIAERLHQAGVPIVLLDRDIYDCPRRSKFDLIGVNNRRESTIATRHLLQLGCRRIFGGNNRLVGPGGHASGRKSGERPPRRVDFNRIPGKRTLPNTPSSG